MNHYDIHTEELIHGKEALEKLEAESFDLILMDLQMPVMDGIVATRMIRSQNITTPIIALTANAFKSEVDKCLEDGIFIC